MKILDVLFDRVSGIIHLPIIILLTLNIPAGRLSAQLITTCPNSNFIDGNYTGWTGCYGYFSNTCIISGFDTAGPHPLYKIIAAPGWLDSNACGGLHNVFPGDSYVARLGDTMYTLPQFANYKEAELKYPVNVSSSSYLFIYRYAVVLQTGGHPIYQQPDFRVEVTDSTGALLDSCGYFYFPAPNSGFPLQAGIFVRIIIMEMSIGKTGQPWEWTLRLISDKQFI